MISIEKYYDKNLENRFFKYIEKTDKCWIWTGSKDSKGRGKIKTSKPYRKELIAPRVAYYIFNKKDPLNLYVCHSCDNPSCVNPEHLWLGTNSDNQKDCYQKGRSQINIYHEKLGHKNHVKPHQN